jgi:hypothetical protein
MQLHKSQRCIYCQRCRVILLLGLFMLLVSCESPKSITGVVKDKFCIKMPEIKSRYCVLDIFVEDEPEGYLQRLLVTPRVFVIAEIDRHYIFTCARYCDEYDGVYLSITHD